jgi:hypothetical protein
MAPEAPIALGFRGHPFHDPFHGMEAAGVPGLDGGQLGDDLLDRRTGGEYGDRLGRQWRRLLRRPLTRLPDNLADRRDALWPIAARPGTGRPSRRNHPCYT